MCISICLQSLSDIKNITVIYIYKEAEWVRRNVFAVHINILWPNTISKDEMRDLREGRPPGQKQSNYGA